VRGRRRRSERRRLSERRCCQRGSAKMPGSTAHGLYGLWLLLRTVPEQREHGGERLRGRRRVRQHANADVHINYEKVYLLKQTFVTDECIASCAKVDDDDGGDYVTAGKERDLL
jgi:hypothetical protein